MQLYTIWLKCSMQGRTSNLLTPRIMILASEDIGNADPPRYWCSYPTRSRPVERVGMPKSQIILSQAVAYMRLAPKSNSAVNAIAAAMDSVKKTDYCAGSSSGRPLRRPRKAWQRNRLSVCPQLPGSLCQDSSTFLLKYRLNIFTS